MKPLPIDLSRLARHWLLALRQFTRIPVRDRGVEADAAAQRAAAVHFPAVGLLLGLAACFTFALIAIALPNVPAAVLVAALACIAATMLLTGAAYEDSLAHVAEALASGSGPERSAALLDEPRLGTHGVLALLLAVGGKVALLGVLAATSEAAVMAALLAAQCVSRFWPLLLARQLPFAADETGIGAHTPLVALTALELQLAGAWCLVPLALLVAADGFGFLVASVGFSGLAFLLVRAWLRARLPVANSDTLGACQQLCELGFYLGAAVVVGY